MQKKFLFYLFISSLPLNTINQQIKVYSLNTKLFSPLNWINTFRSFTVKKSVSQLSSLLVLDGDKWLFPALGTLKRVHIDPSLHLPTIYINHRALQALFLTSPTPIGLYLNVPVCHWGRYKLTPCRHTNHLVATYLLELCDLKTTKK